MQKKMETTIIIYGYIWVILEIMEKKIETTITIGSYRVGHSTSYLVQTSQIIGHSLPRGSG